MTIPTLEITTQIGCIVNCRKYCPQELIVRKLGHIKPLTLNAFKDLMATVPTDIMITFAGFSEPFQNQECPDMILYAHQKGHKISVLSTLTGLTLANAMRICEVPFERFVLHLPDAEGNAYIPITPNYQNTLTYILTHVSNLEFMNMGGSFKTLHPESMARGISPIHKRGRVLCDYLEIPSYNILPDGSLYFCCQTRGLTGDIGSLYHNTYPEIAAQHKKISLKWQRDSSSLCHKCPIARNYIEYHVVKYKEKLTRGQPLLKIFFG